MSFSLCVRRIHMYLGLFVAPWLVMYALSTIVFNHAVQVNRLYKYMYGSKFDQYIPEGQLTYTKGFPDQTNARSEALQILTDLNLNGSFGVEDANERLVIDRRDPFVPRRIILYRATHQLVVERQESRLASVLTTLHTQVSYANKLNRIKAWAVAVDLAIATMLLLVASGFWMWWELKVTRFAGSLFMLLGLMLFGAFLFLA